VQTGEHDFDHRHPFFGVQAEGNATAVVFNGDRAVGVQRQVDALAMPRQGFVGGVVDHLLDDVQGVVGAGVHARSLLDRLQPFEHADGGLAVSRR